MIERRKTLELKKHVAAIHAGNRLSLLQRKIANALLFNAYDELFAKTEHEIHIPTLCKLIGYDSNDHKTIKKALINLLSTVIEWNLVDGDRIDTEGVWNASAMIADASIDGAICTYSYSNKMKNLLHRPELYGRLNMLVQAKFQSTYGLALYENCIRYQNIEQTPWFDILQFRKLMGVEERKYKIFRDFKNRVLNKAVDEVNKYSPIFIVPQFQKQGRQVTAIQFFITLGKKENLDDPNNKSFSLSKVLKSKFGLSKIQIEEVLSLYEGNYILEKITVVENSSSYTNGVIKNLAKYLISALKDDYQPVKPVKVNEDRVEKDRIKKIEQANIDFYNRFRDKQIINQFNALSESEQKVILFEFEKFIEKGLYSHIYRREGLLNMLVQDQLCRFIKDKKPSFLAEIPAYAEFCKTGSN